ncbi:MAG: phosphatidate cytidylyltransferase [Spirochaetaceae bacterium]|nr:phosphatidate cytidylyltransferase [Spirochaetaceae bacterium]
MSKLVQRLLIFFIGIPAVLAIVLFDKFNHILLHVALVVVISVALGELYNILKTKGNLPPKIFLLVLSILHVLMSYLCILLKLSFEHVYMFFVISCLLIFSKEVILPTEKGNNDFEKSIYSIISGIFVIFYIGLLPTFISRLAFYENSVWYISLYFVMTFICDSFAWLFGMLFGKGNRGLIKVSPNKSIAGFICGIFGSILIALLTQHFFPQILPGHFYKAIILGFVVSIFAIIGDLSESLLKRSADCKDSGNVIMGRGGILDSIDSLLFVAPVFYIMLEVLFF